MLLISCAVLKLVESGRSCLLIGFICTDTVDDNRIMLLIQGFDVEIRV